MNFKKWYNSTLASEHTTEKLMASEHGWDACKQEILKILNNNINTYKGDGYNDWNYINENVIEEIKEL